MKKSHMCLTVVGIICLYFQSLQLFAADKKVAVPVNPTINSSITVTNAVVYVPLGKAQTTTAFFTIQNTGANDVSIIKVASPAVKEISLVPMSARAPTEKASADSSITGTSNPWTIPAGKSLALAPQQQYLQLIGLKNSLTTGDELQLEVSLSNGKKVIVIAKAKSAYDQIHNH